MSRLAERNRALRADKDARQRVLDEAFRWFLDKGLRSDADTFAMGAWNAAFLVASEYTNWWMKP